MPTAAMTRRFGAPISLKRADDAGAVEAVFSTSTVIDHAGDRVLSSAFKDGQQVPMCWSHDLDKPIGRGTVRVEPTQAVLVGRFFTETSLGREAYANVKAMGELQQWSFGFIERDSHPGREGERVITALDLMEVSPVVLGANNQTYTASIKSAPGGPLDMTALATRLAQRGVTPLPAIDRRSIAERIALSHELKAFVAGHQQGAKIDLGTVSLKALVSGLAGPVDLRADLTEQPPAALTLVDVLPVYPTQSNRVSVPRVGTSTSAAAPVAEGALKAEAALTFVDGTLPVQAIAHWIAATRQCLEDAGEARAIVGSELLGGLKLAVENQLVNGTGVSPQLAGILSLAGIGTVAVTATNYLGAVLAAMAQVRAASKRPATVVVLSPTAWTAVASAAAPGLLGMSPRGLPTLLGAEVVQSDVLPATTGLVGCAATAPILERQEADVTLGWQGDQFTRNLVTLLCEVRLALVVSRQNAWCKITGLP